jgi:hypothetical protein
VLARASYQEMALCEHHSEHLLHLSLKNGERKSLANFFGYSMTASKSIPLNMLSKWMGHASLEVTAIYANALGEEQRNIAARMWN